MEEVDARLLIDLLLDHRSAIHSLGQHFLHDESILSEAVSLCSDADEPLDEKSHVIEIGPGTGAITEAGLFDAASGGDMLARTVFSVVNKGASDSITITWTITIS